MSAAPARRDAAPAAFVRRYAAWSIDMALLLVPALALCAGRIADGLARARAACDALAQAMARGTLDAMQQGATADQLARQWLSNPALQASSTALGEALVAIVLPPLLLAALLSLAWFAAFEGSPRQATPGKRLLGLRVTGEAGARIGPLRAAARQLAGALSWLTLNLGHLLALLPPRRQALHDRIAGARVVQDADPAARVPGWAAAWLLLQVAAAFAAAAWLFVATQLAMQRAFDALL